MAVGVVKTINGLGQYKGKAMAVQVLGYWRAGDGGGGMFYRDPAPPASEMADGNLVIVACSPLLGHWKRIYSGPLNVRWFGARGDSTGDDAGPINAAIAALPVNLTSNVPAGQVYVPVGTYRVTGTITINRDRTHIIGDGVYATQILFDPSSAAALFEFAKPDGVLFQCSIREMSLLGSGSAEKIAIRAVDTSELLVERIAAFSWIGNHSIALQLRGREAATVRKATFQADLPISIEGNPNHSIDADHYHFEDLYLMIPPTQGSAEACLRIQGASAANPTGVNATNITFEGTNAFVGGRYGICWKDDVLPTPQYASLHLRIRNIRHEQANGGSSGWTVYIDHLVTDLVIDGVAAAVEVNGFYFRQVLNLTMLNCTYENDRPSTALDIDGSCSNIALMNVFFQLGSTVNINTPPGSATGLEEVLSFFQYPNWQQSSFAFYQNKMSGTTPLNRKINLIGQGYSNTSDGNAPSNPNFWNQGDIAWNRQAAVGQPVGWVYTDAAWHPFGTIL